jgi:LPXTG-motif cell wall-anchored protein
MGNVNRSTQLSEQIADILDTRSVAVHESCRLGVRKTIACGSMMMLALNPAQVGALSLGEIELKSRLGQPLEAIVPLTLREGESLPGNCVKPSPERNTLAKLRDIKVAAPVRTGPGTFNVRVSSTKPLHEPMYELSLMVQCPGATLLVRQYVLMLDLPGMPVETKVPVQATNPVPATSGVARSAAPVRRNMTADPTRALLPRTDSIPAGGSYRVARGDTLSTIAKRVEGRLPDTIWAVANQLFVDNPRAFIRNDPNRLKLGSLIRIPAESVLVAMAPGKRLTRAPAETTRTPVISAGPVPERATQPSRAPVTTTRRSADTTTAPSAASATSTSRALPTQTVKDASNTSRSVPGSPQAEAGAERAAPEYPSVAQDPLTASATADAGGSANFNPFADEREPTASGGSVSAEEIPNLANAAASVAPPIDANADAPETGPSMTWLAILIGLLLGAAASLLLLRGRLLAALGVGRQARPKIRVRTFGAKAASSESGAFDRSLAAAAFDGSKGASDLPISGPVEDTYIVEMQPSEPTIENEIEQPLTEDFEFDSAKRRPESAADDDDSAELAKLFSDEAATSPGDEFRAPSVEDPTAEMPSPAGEALDPTVAMPVGTSAELKPTAQLSQQADGDFFDPTAEIPVDALEDIFDPTGGADDIGEAPMESTTRTLKISTRTRCLQPPAGPSSRSKAERPRILWQSR